MGLFDLFKGKRKKADTSNVDIQDLDMEEIFESQADESVAERIFDDASKSQYIRVQCEQITESMKYIEDIKREYETVTEDLNDVQKIDDLTEEEHAHIAEIAEKMHDLNIERDISRKKKSRLPASKYDYYLTHEEELEGALRKLQNDEQYFTMIKKDLNMLEAEKYSLKEDIENSVIRQGNIKTLSIMSLLAGSLILLFMFLSGKITATGENYTFTVILFIMTVVFVLLFALRRNAIYQLKLSEKKLNRAIIIQNKVKIKYINIVNSVEYQYAKYGVKNSYEFANIYQMFLEDKKEREHYAKTTGRLGKMTDELTQALAGIGLRNPEIWHGQVEALYNPKEMVEVRHGLNVRRQKLREQIDYNMKKIEEARKNLYAYGKKNPKYVETMNEIASTYGIELS